jgi:hypothetical protein
MKHLPRRFGVLARFARSANAVTAPVVAHADAVPQDAFFIGLGRTHSEAFHAMVGSEQLNAAAAVWF